MGWRATAWAIKQQTGSPGTKLTLLALANYANGDNVAWPSQQTLADDTEQSIDSIQRHVRALENAGLITVERQDRNTGRWPQVRYQLNLATGPHGAASPGRMVRHHRAARCGSDRAANGTLTGPQMTPKRCRTVRPESLSEPSSERLEPVTINVNDEPSREKKFAEDRSTRPSIDEIKRRLGPNYGLKGM